MPKTNSWNEIDLKDLFVINRQLRDDLLAIGERVMNESEYEVCEFLRASEKEGCESELTVRFRLLRHEVVSRCSSHSILGLNDVCTSDDIKKAKFSQFCQHLNGVGEVV